MRQLTVVAAGRVQWREVPEPTLAERHGALVRPLAAAVCDFDRAVIAGDYPALPYPIAIGHEMVAEVVKLGEEVRTLRLGARVVLPLHISCGACPSCRARRTNSCQARPPLSNYGLGARGGDWGGAMSDLVYVPWADHMAAPLPAGLTALDCAAVGCNLADIHRTLSPQLQRFTDPAVLVVGGRAHNMALYAVVMARALGARRIDFLDDDAERLEEAERLGARPMRMGPSEGRSYPIVVECGGAPERLATALGRVAADGVCTPVWPYAESFAVPVGAMFYRNATLVTGQPHARAHMDPVLDLMLRTGMSSTSIPVEVLPWAEAPEAYGRGGIKRIFIRE
ncbi:zinc-dependent alcohol dehydrogenase [Phenylobacterium sp.]|jgi:alcohol dehydrogenase|uniref:zinc-dependent alcohol dehydrogenase n=1 Tax=Phenylobacterium sp. TaxID=1871053 RepID=UPI002F938CC6